MSEPTLDEMRREVWKQYVDRDSGPPSYWPNSGQALELLREVGKRSNWYVQMTIAKYGYVVRIEDYSGVVGRRHEYDTLGEAAIRLAYAMIKKPK